jgi:dolichol-phosphate mannosyltransferase
MVDSIRQFPRRPVGAAPELSIVVPCHNEQDSLWELYQRTRAAVENEVGSNFELVLINDGSKDGTWACIKQLATDDRRVVGVNLSRNHGHQLALSAGLFACRGKRVLVLDADLQDPPELLPDMMKLMDQGADVVYGRRACRHGETFFKRQSAKLFYRTLRMLTDVPIPEDTGDFRLMSRRVVDVLNAMPEQHRFIRGMVSWAGFRQVPYVYERDPRFAGSTSYSMRRMVRLALDAITSFSVRPLRLAALAGLAFGALGLLGVLYSLVGWALGQTVQGWTSVMVTVLILGGIQLTVMGIIGEYLGRLYMEAKRRPLFVIDEVYCQARDEAGTGLLGIANVG